jgi:hypothetical protein
MSERCPRTVKLPFDFGDIVYHRARGERVAGMVVGFVVLPAAMRILVRWGDDLTIDEHSFFELSSDFTPSFDG